MPQDQTVDFSDSGVAVEDDLDFSEHGIEVPQGARDSGWSPVGEVTTLTPEQLQSTTIAAQRIDPRFAAPRAPAPSLPNLIQTGLHKFDTGVRDFFGLTSEPVSGPSPYSPDELARIEEARQRMDLSERIARLDHPVRTGLAESAVHGVEAMKSPSGVAMLAGAAFAPQVTLPAIFATTAPSLPETVERVQRARQTGDRAEYYSAMGDLLQTAAVVAGTGTGMMSRRPPITLPRSLDALREAGVTMPETIKPPEPASTVAPVARPSAGEHPLLAAARIVEEAAGQVQASGQVPFQRVSAAIARVRQQLEAARAANQERVAAMQAAAREVSGKPREAMERGRAAPLEAAEEAYAAANAAIDRAEATVSRGRIPKSTEPPAPISELSEALMKAATAVRGYQTTVQQRQKQEVPSALQERETTPVLRDVPEQPVVVPGEMPSETGAGGVPRSVEAEKETGRAEVPVNARQEGVLGPTEPTQQPTRIPLEGGYGADVFFDPDSVSARYVSPKGVGAGTLEIVRDTATGQWTVETHEAFERGLGLGRQLIPKIVDRLGELRSDTHPSAESSRMWESLGAKWEGGRYVLRKTPVAKPAAKPSPEPPVANVLKEPHRQIHVDWAEANIPFGETASVPIGPESYHPFEALRSAGISIHDALMTIEGKKPYPTREKFREGVENKYYYDAVDLLRKVKDELSALGLDARKARIPEAGNFASMKEFYQAAYDLELRMRSEGMSIAAALVETGQIPKPFTKKTTPQPAAKTEGLALPEPPVAPANFKRIDTALSAEIEQRGGMERVSKSDVPEDVDLMRRFSENQSGWERAVSAEKAKSISDLSDDAVVERTKDFLRREPVPSELRPEYDALLTEARKRGLQGRLAPFEAPAEAPAEAPKPNETTGTTPTAEAGAKAQTEVSRVAATEGKRSAEAIKKDLVSELTKAWAEAPDDLDAAKPKVTISIPGDGEFTLANTSAAIESVLKKAKRIKTSAEAKAFFPRGAVESSSEAIRRGARDAPVKPPTPAPPEPPISEGPGAKTAGAPKYPAIQQLTDQLEATPKVGTKQGLRLGEKIAEKWAQRGDITTKAIAKARNATVNLLKSMEGIRRASDIDSHLGEYDYAIQYSTAVSKRAGEAIKRQMPDMTDREAAAILIDSARIATKDPARLSVNPDALATPAEVRQVIKDALAILPKDTPKSVREALERALDPSLELRQFTESLKQYFGIREQDAVGADLFEEGLQDYYTHIWQKEANMPGSLRKDIASGRVNTYFQFARQRTIPSLIEGILEGKKPILDPAKVVPFYNFAMDRAIASRTFIRALSDMKASDGRPAVDVRGGAIVQDPLDAKSDPALLITPKTQAREISDFMSINHPAMQKWKWLTKTPEGRQVLMRGEMVVHPEFHEQLARFMDKSRLTSSTAVRRALAVSATAKGLKLGLLPSTFHIVHVGTHAAFHWTNPFKWAPIDFEAPATRFAIEKGHLKLAPSPAELSALQEGVAATGLVRKIPYAGEWVGAFSDWMFHQYIPRLKLNTFENAMNRQLFGARSPLMATGRALKAGRLTESDVAARVGDAVNNAFGELNPLFLGKFGRDPKFQRALRLIFLAPDFGEARVRFALKGFARYGSEERLALATMFGALYFGARLGNWLSHGNAEADDWRHAFEVKMRDEKGTSHWVGMRSVVGDVSHALERPGQFLYVRLNPTYARPTTDLLYGREERTGRKLSAQERMVRAAQAFEPIGLGGLTEPDRTILESLGQSMGLANRRDMAVNDIQRKAHEWREKQGLMPMVEIIPTDEPSYLKLRTALNIGKTSDAKKILSGLLKTRSHKQVEKAMVTYLEHPYAGSNELEKQWVSTFTKEDAQLYLKAQQEKENTLVDFYKLLGSTLKK